MPALHFTEIAVQRLKPTGERYGTTTPTFGIRNRKTWFVISGTKTNRRFLECPRERQEGR
jgi:hypothetical protein